jgi:tetratricopeptide (TPR) repeat protein
LIAWGGVPWGTFQFDDFGNVVRDPATSELAALAARLTTGVRPLTRISYFLDAQLFGLEAAGFLATNLALHLATTLLVHALARRRIGDSAALWAALFFSLQPAHAEVVAYVSGRSTGLMAPLVLAALLLWDRGKRAAALVGFALACLAKEVALVFPLLLAAWELTRPAPHTDARRPLLIASGLALAVGALLLGIARYRTLLGFSLALRSPLENLLANGRAIPAMLSLWVRPWALSPDHAFAEHGSLAASLAGLLAIACALTAAYALRKRAPLGALALAWPLLALLPTSSLIAKLDLVTEKPLYLAWLGPSLALGAAVGALSARAESPRVRRSALAACVAGLCALAAASAWRASLWRDPVRLWLDATEKAPHASRCWNNLGMAQLTAGRDAEALASFQRAVRLDPASQRALQNLRVTAALCGSACDERPQVPSPR